MSFWNFICEVAVFSAVCDLFSSKRKPELPYHEPYIRHHDYDDYPEDLHECVAELHEDIDRYDGHDANEMQERIDDLEDQLLGCDVMSDNYDRILEQIDELESRIADFENAQYVDDIDECDSDDDW